MNQSWKNCFRKSSFRQQSSFHKSKNFNQHKSSIFGRRSLSKSNSIFRNSQIQSNQYNFNDKQLHNYCLSEYQKANELRLRKDQDSKKRAAMIMEHLFNDKLMAYQVTESNYGFKENFILNLWKLMHEIEVNSTKILQFLRVAFLYIKSGYKKLMPKQNKMGLLTIILANCQYQSANYKEAIALCDESIRYNCSGKQINIQMLKIHYIKAKIYHKLKQFNMELDEIRKCIFFIKTINATTHHIGNELYRYLQMRKNQIQQEFKNTPSDSFQRIPACSYNTSCSQFQNQLIEIDNLGLSQTFSKKQFTTVSPISTPNYNKTPIKKSMLKSQSISQNTSVGKRNQSFIRNREKQTMEKVTKLFGRMGQRLKKKGGVRKSYKMSNNNLDCQIQEQLENVDPKKQFNNVFNLILQRPNQSQSISYSHLCEQSHNKPLNKLNSEMSQHNINQSNSSYNQRKSQQVYRQCSTKILKQFIQKYIKNENCYHVGSGLLNVEQTEENLSSWSIQSDNFNQEPSVLAQSTLRKQKTKQSQKQILFEQKCKQQEKFEYKMNEVYMKCGIGMIKEGRVKVSRYTDKTQKGSLKEVQLLFGSEGQEKETIIQIKVYFKSYNEIYLYYCFRVKLQYIKGVICQEQLYLQNIIRKLAQDTNRLQFQDIPQCEPQKYQLECILCLINKKVKLQLTPRGKRITSREPYSNILSENMLIHAKQSYIYQEWKNTQIYLQQYKNLVKCQKALFHDSKEFYQMQIIEGNVIEVKKVRVKRNSIKKINLKQSQLKIDDEEDINNDYKIAQIDQAPWKNIELNLLERSIESVMRYFMWQSTILTGQPKLKEQINFYKIMYWLIGLDLGIKSLKLLFDVQIVHHICRLKNKTYFVKMICYSSKPMYKDQIQIFYKCQLFQQQVRTKMQKLLLTQQDMKKIIGEIKTRTNLDILIALCQKLIIKEKSLYYIVGIKDSNQMFYISNYFLSPKIQSRPQAFCKSFLTLKLNHQVRLSQKLIKILVQNRSQYCLVTLSKILNSKLVNVHLYIPQFCRTMSFNLKQEFIQNLDQNFLKSILNCDSNKSLNQVKDILMTDRTNIKELRNIWNKIIDSMTFLVRNTDERKYLICKISNYHAIVKDCSKTYYFPLKDQMLLMEISLQTKTSLSFNTQKSKENEIWSNSHKLSTIESIPNIYYSQTCKYITYVSILNLNDYKQTNSCFNLMDIVNGENQYYEGAIQNNNDLKQRIYRYSQLLQKFQQLKDTITIKLQQLKSISQIQNLNFKSIILSQVPKILRISLNCSKFGHNPYISQSMVLINKSIIDKNKIECILYDNQQKNLLFYIDRGSNMLPPPKVRAIKDNQFPFISKLGKRQLLAIGERIKKYHKNIITILEEQKKI